MMSYFITHMIPPKKQLLLQSMQRAIHVSNRDSKDSMEVKRASTYCHLGTYIDRHSQYTDLY